MNDVDQRLDDPYAYAFDEPAPAVVPDADEAAGAVEYAAPQAYSEYDDTAYDETGEYTEGYYDESATAPMVPLAAPVDVDDEDEDDEGINWSVVLLATGIAAVISALFVTMVLFGLMLGLAG